MKTLLALLLLVVAPLASAQSITTHYDPNGGIVERVYEGAVNGTRWAYTTSNGVWASATGPGNVARATVGRDLALGSTEGASVAGKLPVLVSSEFTAASLAAGGVKLLRGGIAAVVVGVALDYALKQAHLGFDGLQKSVYYDPPPGPSRGPGSGCPTLYKVQGTPVGDFACQRVDAVNTWAARLGSPTQQARPLACYDDGDCLMHGFVNGNPNAPIDFHQTFTYDTTATGPSSDMVCPNGVTFNDTTKCKELVDDGRAGDLLTPQINAGNGPAIGSNVTGNNGVQFQPDTGLNPGPVGGPGLSVDKAAWPQVSAPGTQSFGPTTTTSTSSSSHTDAGGVTTTTTNNVTTTNTTVVNNTTNNNSVVTNVTNQQRVVSCDQNGICTTTNKTDASNVSQPVPDDQTKPCGLPSTPACKIDETGTPTPADGDTKFDAGRTALDAAKDAAIANVTASGDPTTKDTAWKFSFAFPTACSPLVAWSGMSFDICRFKPMIHDLMSLVWYSATAFMLVGMFGRTIRGEA